MKIVLMILMLTLTTLGFTQDSDPKIRNSKQYTDQTKSEKQEQQEAETSRNSFQVGPYKNSQYEYFNDQDREAAAQEREKAQQSQ